MKTDYPYLFRTANATPAADRVADRVADPPDDYATEIDRRQRDYLRKLVRRWFPERRPVQHDFACGTGRAIQLLHGVVRAAHGYDSSPVLLARAREAGVYAKLHRVPEHGPVPVPANLDGPKLVTALGPPRRWSPPRRASRVPDRAVAFAATALPHWDSGLFILADPDPDPDPDPGHPGVDDLLPRHGFEVVERRGFAICPPAAYQRTWLRPVARRLDDLATRGPALSWVAGEALLVARRVRG